MLDPPGEVHPPHGPRRGVQVARPAPPRPARPGTRPGSAARRPAALLLPAAARDGPRRGQVARAQRADEPQQRRPVGTEAGDHQAGVRSARHHQRPGRDQQVHALRGDELPDIADDLVAGRVGGPDGLPGIGFPAPGGRVGLQPVGQRPQPRPGLARGAGAEPADVDARPEQPGAGGKIRHADDLEQALRGMPRPGQHAGRPGQPLAGVRAEPRDVGPDGVLERRAVDLDRVRDPAAQRAGQDHRAHDQVVGQRQVRPDPLRDVRDGRGVGRDVALDLGVGQLGKRPRVEPGVLVGHVERQDAADVGHVGRAPGRPPRRLDVQRAVIPAADGVDEAEFLRRRSWQNRCTSWPRSTSARVSSAL